MFKGELIINYSKSSTIILLLVAIFSNADMYAQQQDFIKELQKLRVALTKKIITKAILKNYPKWKLIITLSLDIYSPSIEMQNYINEISRYYGYEFFKRDSIPFWENLPTPSNYILGPGDELIISLWGQTQLRNSFINSRDGKIYDDKVGLLN